MRDHIEYIGAPGHEAPKGQSTRLRSGRNTSVGQFGPAIDTAGFITVARQMIRPLNSKAAHLGSPAVARLSFSLESNFSDFFQDKINSITRPKCLFVRGQRTHDIVSCVTSVTSNTDSKAVEV